ncbi:MAG: hypothetical protein K8U57_39675 [Planctomycetes bacterium]|nr:hypothetical protein [Planctomycetota bacterium]
MPTQPNDPATPPSEATLRAAALEQLKKGSNPFATQVAAVGTADESLLTSVPEFGGNQLAELLDIVGLYRSERPTTRVYPILGDRGSGKTHLLYSLREELRGRAADTGDETLVVVVERLSPGMDAIDYLLWQIVNHLLAQRGEGGRLLGVIAGRLTGRILGEALRQLGPHQRVALIPSGGFWSRLGIGGGSKAQAKLEAIDNVIQQCDAKHPTTVQLRGAVEEAGLTPEIAMGVIQQHLDRTESKDVVGWLRKELYARLARVALLNDREPFEDLHGGDFEDTRANVKNAGNLGRRLLETWLELLSVLNIPVVVVFDQLEDYVNASDPEQRKLNRTFFTDSTAKFINELRNVCLLVFSENALWFELVTLAEGFSRERLTQPFALPGRPAKPHLVMPTRVDSGVLEKLIGSRLRAKFEDLDLTGLPPTFPFEAADLKKFGAEPSIRMCLRGMGKRYDEIVHKQSSIIQLPDDRKPPPSQPDFKKRLAALWREKVSGVAKEIGNATYSSTAFIPEVQNALDGWLQCLFQHDITGSGPWHKVELVTDTKKNQYGYLCVIRTNGKNAPGIGIGAWLGQAKWLPFDLKQRAAFFKLNPCPISTLIMLRADGDAALSGPRAKEVFDAAIAKHDIRVHQYEPHHLHDLMAFSAWHQASTAELQTTKETDPNAEKAFRDFLAELSKELIAWIDDWRKPHLMPQPVSKGAKT